MAEASTGAGKERVHSFCSRARDGMYIDGVRDVVSFDDGGVVLVTECGSMAVEGEGLHVKVLNIADGIVELSGRINGAYYFEDKPTAKRGLFGKKSAAD